MARPLIWLVPVILLLAGFGRLVARPSSLLVDATRPTIDRARVVDATPGNDLTRQFWPTHRAIAQKIQATGHLPGWDDRGFGGRPLIGNPQAGLFYPPVWLAWLIPAPAMLGWITLGHLIWAGFGMIRLSRLVGLGQSGRMVAAGCFSMSPYVLAQTSEGHYPHVWSACWYPWAFEAVIRLGQGRWSASLALAVSLAAVLLSGHPQEGYYLILALGVRVASDLIRLVSRRASWARIPPILAAWSGLSLLTLGLVAVEMIPDTLGQTWALRASRLPLSLASRYHPTLDNLWQVLNPLALGGPTDYFGADNYWETMLGVGLIPLILALVGITWTSDRTRVEGWTILVVAAVLFASGRKLGLFALMYEWVPGIDRFRVPSRSLFLANLGTAVLAGCGVEAFAGSNNHQRWVRLSRCWLVGLVLCLVAIHWGISRVSERGLSPASFGSSGLVEESRAQGRSATEGDRTALALDRIARQGPFWLALIGISAALAWGIWRPVTRPAVAVALGLLGLVELTGEGFSVLVTSSPAAWLAQRPIDQAILANLPDRTQPGSAPPRIRADESILSDLKADHLGLVKTDINDTFQIQHAADLYQRLYDLSRPRPANLTHPLDGSVAERRQQIQQAILDRMAVALVAGDDRSPRLRALVESRQWPEVVNLENRDEGPGRVFVARNLTALPRAYVVPRARLVANESHARMIDSLAGDDPRQAVVMTEDPLASLPGFPRQPFLPASWHSTDPDRVTLTVTTSAPGLLVVADTWMPGWTATVDGQQASVERGNHAQRVVTLPVAGRHQVILTYQAPGFKIGLRISLIAAGIWLLLSLIAAIRSSRSIT